MDKPFPPFDPDDAGIRRQRRVGALPFRKLFPSILTLLAIGAGMTSIRFASQDRLEWAVVAIVFAAILDGLDGRAARYLKSTSRFGEQLDSLADFLNFGVAPAMLLYFAISSQLGALGWIASVFFTICACLRLARFNATLDQPDRPKWQARFFTGVPAPAGALTVLMPIYGLLLGWDFVLDAPALTAIYALLIGLLMVSSLPTYSGKEFGKSVPRDQALPLMLAMVVGIAMLLSYPWTTMLVLSLVYLATLPLGYRDWHRHQSGAVSAAYGKDGDPNSGGNP